MPKEFSRTRRVGLQIQRDLADLIRSQIKDPRIGLISVNAVHVSRDLSHAKVYITALDDDHREESLAIIKKASGFLRHELGQLMTTRIVPQLHFFYDESIENGSKLTSLIEDAVSSDKKNHQEDE
ncbi:MAG: 30S ribosome-binding factor RbfA [Gammaproteobacteria bacterium]|nr:30S ribosome-binding factor RbfA [Gammaproteobacteria bacterium]